MAAADSERLPQRKTEPTVDPIRTAWTPGWRPPWENLVPGRTGLFLNVAVGVGTTVEGSPSARPFLSPGPVVSIRVGQLFPVGLAWWLHFDHGTHPTYALRFGSATLDIKPTVNIVTGGVAYYFRTPFVRPFAEIGLGYWGATVGVEGSETETSRAFMLRPGIGFALPLFRHLWLEMAARIGRPFGSSTDQMLYPNTAYLQLALGVQGCL